MFSSFRSTSGNASRLQLERSTSFGFCFDNCEQRENWKPLTGWVKIATSVLLKPLSSPSNITILLLHIVTRIAELMYLEKLIKFGLCHPGHNSLYISCAAISTTHLNAGTKALLWSMHASYIFCNTNTSQNLDFM